MENNKKEQPQHPGKKKSNEEEAGQKRSAPEQTGYITGGENRATRPEQGPDVPPQERTEGIP
ncbi:hypothetical protein [Pontibacter actiniarum]|uniref:Uncharacterized protein n=1 Tax=Pontibacter actiniarum TaxID=323450 RepID=A0A1X9YQY7_9BACT|nr:hypothetical protein [Pontibacter actiniarum]ARS35290.1 hypothetical protein CA264_07465 [Pontibacter actiniarum]